MRLMVIGDVHGNMKEARQLIVRATDTGVQHIVWCGDCGLWPGLEGMEFLDEVNWFARRANVRNYLVGGNHEWWPEWIRVVRNNPQDALGFAYLRSHILLAPRIHSWIWDRKRFASAAGAVSIDRQWRTPGKSWWPEEQLTDIEVTAAENVFGRRNNDYLFTHDCSNYTPWGHRLKPDLDSQIHRQRIDRIIAAARPKMHFHGHFHEKYDWKNTITNPNYLVRTFGLTCDGMQDNWGILDTSDDTFLWRGVERSRV